MKDYECMQAQIDASCEDITANFKEMKFLQHRQISSMDFQTTWANFKLA